MNKSDLLHFLHAMCVLSATNEYRHIVISFFLVHLNYDYS